MDFLFKASGAQKRMLGEFEVGETLGEGMSSKVKCGKHSKTGQLVALKIMDPKIFKTREVQRELEILRYFGEPQNRHPNVSGLVTVLHDVEFCSKHGAKSSYISKRVSVIVTEYMDSGDLFSYLSSGIPFNEETACAVFQQVVRGLSHLHKHGVVHLDLKPENILMGKNGIVKLADFGLSEVVKPLRTRSRNGKSRRPRLISADVRASEHQSGARSVSGSSSGYRSRRRRLPSGYNDIRTVASLTSLESMNSSNASLDSPSPSPSPLVNFFPPNSKLGSSPSMGRMPSLSLSSFDEAGHLVSAKLSLGGDGIYDMDTNTSSGSTSNEGSVVPNPEDDEQLLAAISKGRTRQGSTSEPDFQDFDSAAKSQRIHESMSLNNLSSLHHSSSISRMGAKTASYHSMSSLDSDGSVNSHGSGSRSVARYKTPKLVVNSRSGTLSYQAPEVAKGRYCGSKADVYSLGVVLHVMLFGVLPYEEGEWIRRRDFYERLGRVSDDSGSPGDVDSDGDLQTEDDLTLVPWTLPNLLQRDVTISDEARDLLSSMLYLSPETRFSLKDVMRHPWVDASRVRGSVQKVAAVVKRREPYVLENRKNQTYMRKARKRGYGPHVMSDEALFL
mmetsp:Transcript_3690/g.8078  ORF Transcript_3690/g.8078 Transcript_3690/m.8078 type:complete len:615 (+) Transcript_3690:844-2688(+)|eukprot:CAMPEP_0171496598 /NCGR_PEP_ID=MMETSP0958-20121227/6796_1 /TAXON_ID=87120 /ORGANISM="Aurantiochytrium limacinum, Strain ATCCMYA-1381" /LENGTH=614 /DNA_ID=CAMNT_0012030729 /DNA_START=789 /DNA_END=2633 /DNA_ORIENTATION=-